MQQGLVSAVCTARMHALQTTGTIGVDERLQEA